MRKQMRKISAVIITLFLCNFTIATTRTEMLQDLTSMWLHPYDPNDNAPWLHDDLPNQYWGNPDYNPYDSYAKTFVLWDLNMDGMVNMIDFSMFSKLDLEMVLAKKEQKYKQVLCGPTTEDLIVIAELDIMDLNLIREMMTWFEADIRMITCIINSKQEWLNRKIDDGY
jgi:hypothetical protein